MDASGIEVRMLGPVEIRRGGSVVAAGGPTQRAVLAMLALRTGEPVPVDELADGIWGENDEQPSGSAGVKVHISRIRAALSDGATGQSLLTVARGYRLDSSGVQVDTAEFERLLNEGRRQTAAGDAQGAVETLTAALALWRGPALMDVRDFPFAAHAALRLDELRVDAVEELTEARLALGESAALIPELRGLVAEHPYRERLHGQLMIALYRSGQQAAALDAFTAARTRLAVDLGVEPGPELERLQRAILEHAPELDDAVPSEPTLGLPAPMAAPQPPLPAAPELVGRDALLAELEDQASSTRLLTLTGAGGTGKTVLSVALLHRVAPRFSGGAAFVDLAAVSDTDQVLPAVAAALGVAPDRSPLANRLADFLAERQFVIVLDNCEHLLGAVPDLAALAGATRGLLIATSRVPLGLRVEHLVAVPPLPLPGLDDADLSDEPAVVLFRRAAADAGATLAGTPAELDAIGAICRAVDGLPLAIEIAAAQTRLETVTDLAATIGERLPYLRHRAGDMPDRQRTMEGAIRWSLDRLAAERHEPFARLAVFAGAFDANGAAALLRLDRPATIEVLADLLDASLLTRQATGGGQARFRMLEPIRGVARTLAEPEAQVTARADHAAYFAAEVDRLCPAATGIQRPEDLSQLRLEHSDLLAAIEYLGDMDPEQSVDLAVQLEDYWSWTGTEIAADRLMQSVLAGPLSSRPRCDALLLRASFLFGFGLADDARVALSGALTLRRRSLDHATRARLFKTESRFAREASDRHRALPAARKAIAEARLAGGPRLLAQCLRAGLQAHGWWGRPGVRQMRECRAWVDEALALAQGIPMPLMESDLIIDAISENADEVETVRAVRSALEIDHAFDAPPRVAFHAIAIGWFLARSGSIAEGRAMILWSLRTLDRGDHRVIALQALQNVGEFEGYEGRWWNSVVLWSACLSQARAMGTSVFEIYMDDFAPDPAEAHLGPAAYAMAREIGERMTYREAVDFAFEICGVPP